MVKQTGISMRAVIVMLKSPYGGRSTAEIAALTGVSQSQVNRIYAKAIERGFNPYHYPFILRDEWLSNAPGAGRPRKNRSADQQSHSQEQERGSEREEQPDETVISEDEENGTAPPREVDENMRDAEEPTKGD